MSKKRPAELAPGARKRHTDCDLHELHRQSIRIYYDCAVIHAVPSYRQLPLAIPPDVLPHTLEIVDIAGPVPIASLEPLASLTRLRVLGISKQHQYTALPDAISSLVALEELRIRKCSRLATVPDWIGTLERLALLSVEYCPRVCTLPQSIGQLSNLRTLSVSGCTRLRALPRNLYGLCTLSADFCMSLRALPIELRLRSLKIHECTSLGRVASALHDDFRGCFEAYETDDETEAAMLATEHADSCSFLSLLPGDVVRSLLRPLLAAETVLEFTGPGSYESDDFSDYDSDNYPRCSDDDETADA